MARVDEQELAVAGVYARALLGLARDRVEADQIEEQLADLAGLLDANPELDGYLSSPLADDEARSAALEKAFRNRANPLVVNTLQVMNAKGRLGLLRALAESFRLANEHLRGEVDVEVTTAVELSEELRRRIAVSASRYAGRTARLIEKVEPDLLGGLVLRIGDRKIDSSLARRIHDARENLFRRASEELHGDKTYFEN